MGNEIERVEGEVITEKTPEQAGRELGEAWAKLKQTVNDLSKGFKQVSGKPPIVIEDELTNVADTEYPGELAFTFAKCAWDEDSADQTVFHAYQDLYHKLLELKGKRVRVTIEVLEDSDHV
jgi:hypothetical protein